MVALDRVLENSLTFFLSDHKEYLRNDNHCTRVVLGNLPHNCHTKIIKINKNRMKIESTTKHEIFHIECFLPKSMN